jgi:hypothetical protein
MNELFSVLAAVNMIFFFGMQVEGEYECGCLMHAVKPVIYGAIRTETDRQTDRQTDNTICNVCPSSYWTA